MKKHNVPMLFFALVVLLATTGCYVFPVAGEWCSEETGEKFVSKPLGRKFEYYENAENTTPLWRGDYQVLPLNKSIRVYVKEENGEDLATDLFLEFRYTRTGRGSSTALELLPTVDNGTLVRLEKCPEA